MSRLVIIETSHSIAAVSYTHLDVYKRQVPDIANKAFEDQCTTANPKLPLVKEIEQIMIDAYKGVN